MPNRLLTRTCLRMGCAALALLGLVASGSVQAARRDQPKLSTPTPVQVENAKTEGVTPDWAITSWTHSAQGEIAGYASATSVNRGASINFMISVGNPSADPSYSLEIFRMGWYGGAGARRVHASGPLASSTQASCGRVSPGVLDMVECAWTPSYTWQVPLASDPTVGMSGTYLVKLTTQRGLSNFIPFVVRDDARKASFMFQSSHTTFQAYNNYGGYGYYFGSDPGGRVARVVSFNRPYHPGIGYGSGHFLSWEYHAVRFLEREGFDVVYSTNLDTHQSPQRLQAFRGFLSVGHDEYWTRAMYDAIEGARNVGVNLAFLGANTAYWQVRLEPDAAGRADRRMVGYRYWAWGEDPMVQTNFSLATLQWRQVGRAEAALVGVQYENDPVDGALTIQSCPRWMCKGTGVTVGQVMPHLWGYEADVFVPGVSPAHAEIISRTPFSFVRNVNGVDTTIQAEGAMTHYVHAASGASVFATGSMQWNWGLDDYPNYRNHAAVNAGAQGMMRNILTRFLTSPLR